MNRRHRNGLIFAALILAVAMQTGAQTTAPPPAGSLDNSQGLEVELVEAHNRMAIPSEIHRKAGKFILVVANRMEDPASWFVVDAAPAAQAAASEGTTAAPTTAAGHVLAIGSGQSERKRRAGAIFDAAAGTYQLKGAVSGTVLCTIVIE